MAVSQAAEQGRGGGAGSANVMENPRFGAGSSGWQAIGVHATGVRWSVVRDGERDVLKIAAAAAVGGAAGGVFVYSPRTPGGPGPWTGRMTVRLSAPAVVDLAVVADGFVLTPDSPYVAPPQSVCAVDAGSDVVIETSRDVPEWGRAVGLRLGVPLGVDVEVVEASLDGPAAVDALTGLSVGIALDQPDAVFTEGAVVTVGEPRSASVLLDNAGAPRRVRLRVRHVDCYDGPSQLLFDGDVEAGSGTTAHVVQLLTDVPGVWRLDAEVMDGTATRIAELRYLVTDPDGHRGDELCDAWAVTSNLVDVDRTASMLRLLGIGATRVYTGLAAWDLPGITRLPPGEPADAVAEVLALMPAPAGSPALAAAREARTGSGGFGPGGWPDFRAATTVAEAFGEDELEPAVALFEPLAGMSVLVQPTQVGSSQAAQRVIRVLATALSRLPLQRAWMAENEPDLSITAAATASGPEDFATVQRSFAEAVRAGDPEATLVGPAIADGWDSKHQNLLGWEYIERWAAAGGLDAVDVVSFHTHMIEEESQAPEREDWEGVVRRLRALVDRLGGDGKGLWDTEMGWRSSHPARYGYGPSEAGPYVSEAAQADLLVRAAVLANAAGLDVFYAFHLHGFREFADGCRFDWGLTTGSASGPKAAFQAVCTLTAATRGCGRGRRLRTAARTRAVLFEAADRGSAFVWQWSGGPRLWRLDSPPVGVELRTLMGAPTAGDDLRSPVVVSWVGAAAEVERWLERALAERYA